MQIGMGSNDFIKAVNYGRKSNRVITMVVIYEHPMDFPNSYVGRLHFVGAGRKFPSREIFIVRDTLDEVRAAIPAGMVKLDRSAKDDPRIVETYI